MRQNNERSAFGPGSDFAVEATAIGPQSLVPGVAPITPGQRLQWRADAPLAPKKPQRAIDHGLFDLNARNQLDLFQPAPRGDDGAPRPCPVPSPSLEI